MFDFNYWMNRCASLYSYLVDSGYGEVEALYNVERMLYLFEYKYGRLVINEFLDLFEKSIRKANSYGSFKI